MNALIHRAERKEVNMSTDSNEASVQSVVHTPGPWATCNTTIYAVDDGEPIARCLDKEIHRAFSDAKLIAAAPTMLEALRRIVRHQDIIGGSMASVSSTRHIAAQAIQHATGEQV